MIERTLTLLLLSMLFFCILAYDFFNIDRLLFFKINAIILFFVLGFCYDYYKKTTQKKLCACFIFFALLMLENSFASLCWFMRYTWGRELWIKYYVWVMLPLIIPFYAYTSEKVKGGKVKKIFLIYLIINATVSLCFIPLNCFTNIFSFVIQETSFIIPALLSVIFLITLGYYQMVKLKNK